MEEKDTKVVDMPTNPQKLPYEQLEGIAMQLQNKLKEAAQRIQELNMSNMFKRMEFLLEIVKNPTAFTKEFASKCAQEIEDIMTIPEPQETEE